MDIYHIWCDLNRGVSDTAFVDAVDVWLGQLKQAGSLESYRVTRRKLGLGGEGLGEFHLMLEFNDLSQLDRAFSKAASRAEPIESFHHAVNSKVSSVKFALYRDFPDPVRKRGEEKF